MPADEEQKWPSPHGHSIASSETDKITKTPENVSCENLTNTELLAEAVKVIECYYEAYGDIYIKDMGQYRARDFLAKIEG